MTVYKNNEIRKSTTSKNRYILVSVKTVIRITSKKLYN